MSRFLSVVLPYCLALLLVCGALLTFLVSIFYLGSQEQHQQQLIQIGYFSLLGLRFLAAGIAGLVLAGATAAISLAFRRWHRPGTWAAPKPVLLWAIAVNLLCGLLGSLMFVWPA